MRFAHGTTSLHTKTATDLRIGAKKRWSGRDGQEPTFARCLVPFDFRPFQRYRPGPDIDLPTGSGARSVLHPARRNGTLTCINALHGIPLFVVLPGD
jgi:hypothetical protein